MSASVYRLKTTHKARKFDEVQLRYLIRGMTRRTRVYRVLKEELQARGWWKNRPRGRHAR